MFLDVVYLLLIIVAAFKGMQKGLIVALFSIFAFIAGLAAALKLSAVVAARLSVEVSPAFKWLPMLSFLLVFILVVFVVNLGGRIIQKAVETILLGWINRVGGMILYVALYTFIFSIILFFASQAHLINANTIASSFFYPYIQPLGPRVINAIGDLIPFFKNMFEELQKFFGGFSNKM